MSNFKTTQYFTSVWSFLSTLFCRDRYDVHGNLQMILNECPWGAWVSQYTRKCPVHTFFDFMKLTCVLNCTLALGQSRPCLMSWYGLNMSIQYIEGFIRRRSQRGEASTKLRKKPSRGMHRSTKGIDWNQTKSWLSLHVFLINRWVMATYVYVEVLELCSMCRTSIISQVLLHNMGCHCSMTNYGVV